MNFDDYMKKIQYIANLLEQNRYAENIINSKNIDVIQDFQYICLSSASNPKLVNDIIARLAQNGNANVVLKNIKSISMEMWKDLFDQNEFTKKIFIENYNTIFDNTSILTFREIERFINDTDTCNLIYNSLDSIIKKLCTYDRASLISLLKSKQGGIERIQANLKSFFQKGEYDISTTYSKILIELSKIDSISKLEILDACDENLVEMLNRETAVDNETNKMLNWLYDTFEETKMTVADRAEIKQNIDNAILQNFDYILDRSNYDRNTIKILKQFDCTKEKFENNKNHYIDKSDKACNKKVNYTMNINDLNKNLNASIKIDKIVENTKENLNRNNANLKVFISEKEKSFSTDQNNLIKEDEKEILNIVPFEIDNVIDDVQTIEKKNEIDLLELYKLEDDVNEKTENSNIIKFETYNKQYNPNSHLQDINVKKMDTLNESIKKLILSNIEDTDKIIERALKKDKIENEVEQRYDKIFKEMSESQKSVLNFSKQIENESKTNTVFKEKTESDECYDKIEDDKSMILAVNNNDMEVPKKDHIIKRIWRKILKIFGLNNKAERIGE